MLRTFQSEREILRARHGFEHKQSAALYTSRQAVRFFRQLMALVARFLGSYMVCAPFCPISGPNLQPIRVTPRTRHAASIFVLDALVGKTVGSGFKKLAEGNFAAFRRQSVQRQIREGSQWTTNQNVRSAASAGTQRRARLWQPPRTKSRRHKRPRTFEPTCAPGVTLGTLQKIPEKLGRVVDSSVDVRLYRRHTG